MMKRFPVFVFLVVVVAGGLFFRQILDAVSGMSVLEMLQKSVNFVLHVIVVSILGYVAYTINGVVQPWIRTFQQKQRHHRRQLRGRRTHSSTSRSQTVAPQSRRGTDLLWLISQLARQQRDQSKQRSAPREPRPRIRF